MPERNVMDVAVDHDTCIRSGMCTTIAPNVFRFADDGELLVLQTHVPEEDEDPVLDAEESCPVGAIRTSRCQDPPTDR